MSQVTRILAEFGLTSAGDADLLFEFFIRFSRFEHSLLERGFARKDGDGWSSDPGCWSKIVVDWESFTSAAHAAQPAKVDGICLKFSGFMKDNPPSVVVREDKTHTIRWGYSSGEAIGITPTEGGYALVGPYNLSRLSVLVRRIRNNLFHGTKFRDPRAVTIERVNSALSVLQEFETLLESI